MNLADTLGAAAGRWPERAAVIEAGETTSYAELQRTIAHRADRLRELGMEPGHRVGIRFPNSLEYIALTYAVWKVGGVVVPVGVESSDAVAVEIERAMELDIMLSHEPGADRVTEQAPVHCAHIARASGCRFHERDRDIAFIRFTSGTTSERKGVVLRHATVAERIGAINKTFGIGPHDTVAWCLPMSHHFLATIVLFLSHGATILLTSLVLPRPFLDAASRYRATVLYATPYQYSLLAADGSDIRLPSVRVAISTTSPLDERTAVVFRERFGFPLCSALGIIEAGLVCMNLDDPVTRWSSVGRPLPDYSIHIAEPDEGGNGEVLVKGPGMLDAYESPRLERDEILSRGWFATGDIGRLDEDGYLFLVGRKTAVINLAGRKVFPETVERVLDRHDSVVESRVYALPHPRTGETVAADVVTTAPIDVADLQQFCRRYLGPHEIPSKIRFVDRVARTDSTGKVSRRSLFRRTT